LERRSGTWDTDPDASRAALSAALSLVLRLLGRDPDPAKSREHVFLAVLAERRLLAGKSAELGALLQEVLEPPIERIGALPVDDFLSPRERRTLASALNALLASPTFTSWRQGTSLDVQEWLTPKAGRTQAVVVSVAHLDDEERALVLGVLLEEILAYTRSLRGTNQLRALIVLDEVYGLLPPHPANPPTKRPIVQLMKQGRAFGIGVLLASQNPMDLDYRALSNAGFWAVGRLQTDADRERVVESLVNANEPGTNEEALHALLRKLGPRWFVVRNVHQAPSTALLQPRWALSFLRGPMTLGDIRGALASRSS
jgi:DNA helicase HerA-like ATPase